MTTSSVVTGIDESLGEEALIQSHKIILDELTTHLQPETKDLWKSFLKFKEAWIRPKVGQVTLMEASFTHLLQLHPLLSKKSGTYKTNSRTNWTNSLNKQLDKLLEAGAIRPSKSSWGSRPLFVKKQSGKWRIFLYRYLNKNLVSDIYPLPLLWDNL